MSESVTGFAGVPFRILRNGLGPEIVADFQRESIVTRRHIPGSNTTETFLMGQDAPVVTWRIESPTFDDFADLEALIQTEGDLRIPHGISTAPHTEEVWPAGIYDLIADVLLVALPNRVTRNDGTVRADAILQGGW